MSLEKAGIHYLSSGFSGRLAFVGHRKHGTNGYIADECETELPLYSTLVEGSW